MIRSAIASALTILPAVPMSIRLATLLCAFACLLPTPPAFALDEAHAALVPDGSPLVLTIRDPLRLEDHPLVTTIYYGLLESAEYRRYLDSPNFEPLLQLKSLAEGVTSKPWREFLSDLIGDGVTFAVAPGEGEDVVLLVTARDEQTVDHARIMLKQIVQAEAVRRMDDDVVIETVDGDVTRDRFGDLRLVSRGRRLCMTDSDAVAESFTAKLPTLAPPATSDADSDAEPPLLEGRVLLDAFKQDEEFAKFIGLPRDDDAATLAFLGGYVDLLKRGSEVSFRVDIPGNTLSVRLGVDAPRSAATDGLGGFFATEQGAHAAPLLDLPEMIYSTSWYRDYQALHEARTKTLSEDLAKSFDEQNSVLGGQLSTVGLKVTPAELITGLGTSWRIAIARQPSIPYRVELDSQLPAGVFCVNLRNEDKSEEQLSSLLRTARLIIVGANNNASRASVKQSEYEGATLDTISFRDDEESAAQGDTVRYNFSPTTTITRGHFIAGSTEEIVRQTIDALDRQAESETDATADSVTEEQYLSAGESAAALRQFHEQLLKQVVFATGLSVPDAEEELSVGYSVLQSLGPVRTVHTFDDEGFRVTLTIRTADE